MGAVIESRQDQFPPGDAGAGRQLRPQRGPVLGRRHAYVALEHAVEARNGPEPCGEDDLRDAQRRIHQQRLGFLHPDARHVFGERHAGGLLEQFAEIEAAHVDVPHHLLQADRFLDVRLDKLLGAGHHARLLLHAGDRLPAGVVGQILRENVQQLENGLEAFRRDDGRFKVGLARLLLPLAVQPVRDHLGHHREVALGRLAAEHLAAHQRGHVASGEDHGHRHVRQAGEAGDLLGNESSRRAPLGAHLDFQTRRAASWQARHQGAEPVFRLPEA